MKQIEVLLFLRDMSVVVCYMDVRVFGNSWGACLQTQLVWLSETACGAKSDDGPPQRIHARVGHIKQFGLSQTEPEHTWNQK